MYNQQLINNFCIEIRSASFKPIVNFSSTIFCVLLKTDVCSFKVSLTKATAFGPISPAFFKSLNLLFKKERNSKP